MYMTVPKYLIRAYLTLRYLFHKMTSTGSFGPDRARFLKGCKESGNEIKEGLFRHHVKQFHDSSCSVASLVSVVNTLLEKNNRLPHPRVTQQEILDRVRTAHWKERMGERGYRGRRGLPIEVLGQVTRAAMAAYHIPYEFVEIIQAPSNAKEVKTVRRLILRRLREFETKGNCILIAHFDQGSLVRAMNIPHISPVGGFDPRSGRVTMLDVDVSQKVPYEISFDRFYAGISTHYCHVFRLFGYGRGGLVVIRL